MGKKYAFRYRRPGSSAFFAALILIGLVFATGCGGKKEKRKSAGRESTDTAEGKDSTENGGSQRLSYQIMTSLRYDSDKTRTCVQSNGVLVVDRRESDTKEATYTYGLHSEVNAGKGDEVAKIDISGLTFMRSASQRFVGGTGDFCREIGQISNAFLDQAGRSVVPDGKTRNVKLSLAGHRDFPSQISYRMSARVERLGLGQAISVFVVSDPFSYCDPSTGKNIIGRHRFLAILSPDMHDLYFACSNFKATPQKNLRQESLRIECLMYGLKDDEPMDLVGVSSEFERQFNALELMTSEQHGGSTGGMPMWALHSAAVRDVAALGAGALAEGKPNFAITATIGMVMLADSAASAGTGLLKRAGLIDWEWKGISNYVGQGVGLVAAHGYEKITGRPTNKKLWREIGGITADVASMFIPSSVLGTGTKIGTHGVKVVKGVDLTGKKLRISEHGLDVVKGGKGWLDSHKTSKILDLTQKSLTSVQSGMNLKTAITDTPKPNEDTRSKWKTEEIPDIDIVLVHIKPGSFMMGEDRKEFLPWPHEKPVHKVTLTREFWMGKTEITQRQYEAVMGYNPSLLHKGPSLPVTHVPWGDAVAFCNKLTELERRAGRLPQDQEYRLPTEAEWEYCCRATSKAAFCFGDKEAELGAYAWYGRNARGKLQPVGRKKPNVWGLHDMHGNAFEWCNDRFAEYPSKGPKGLAVERTDPKGPASGAFHVARGGDHHSNENTCRSTNRVKCPPASPGWGFRVVRAHSNSASAENSPGADHNGSASIRGYVTIKDLRMPGVCIEVLSGGKVVGRTGSKGFADKANGSFAIAGLPPGKKLVVRSYLVPYPKQVTAQEIVLKAGESRELNLKMKFQVPLNSNSDLVFNPHLYQPAKGKDAPYFEHVTPLVKVEEGAVSLCRGTIVGDIPKGGVVSIYYTFTYRRAQLVGKTDEIDRRGRWTAKLTPYSLAVTDMSFFARLLDSDGVMLAQSRMIKHPSPYSKRNGRR